MPLNLQSLFHRDSQLFGGAPGGQLLQGVAPAARFIGMILLLIGANVTHSPLVLAGLFAMMIVGATASAVNVSSALRLALIPVIVFALPSWLLAHLISVTGASAMLLLRTFVSCSIASIMVHSIGLRQISNVLQSFHVPADFILIWRIMIAQIAAFAIILGDMAHARSARQIARPAFAQRFRHGGMQAGVLLQKTDKRGFETALALNARTIAASGEAPQFSITAADLLFISLCLTAAVAGVIW